MAAHDDDRDEDVGAGFPVPSGAPSDWSTVVHASAWTDLERLGLWLDGTGGVPQGADPSGSFGTVAPGSLGADPTAPIYVVVHGWAPGYRPVVDAAGGRIQWWSKGAHVGQRWASDWCWAPVIASTSAGPVAVDDTGVAQQIAQIDPTATILAYSWIDDSATASGAVHLADVYRSEAYTHLNGIRLANALDQAIDPAFFTHGGQLRLIGHSHGSKVCTVAALTLQARGTPATHLAILDAPESHVTLMANGANLLGVYLADLAIRDPSSPTARGTYVDSSVSYFGVRYASATRSPIENIVQVALAPSHLYGRFDPTDDHTYAAAWYGGAAPAGAGLAWPPVPTVHTPSMNQQWGPGNQWTLTAGPSPVKTSRYATPPLTFDSTIAHGGVVERGGAITFRTAGGTPYSSFIGTYTVRSGQYGVAFDLDWATPGLFVMVGSHEGGSWAYTLLVLDGRSIPAGTATSVAVSSDVWDIWTRKAEIQMYYLPYGVGAADGVRVSDIRAVEIS